MSIAAWDRPEVLNRVLPREYGPRLTAEEIVLEVLNKELGGIYWPWAETPARREERASGLIWHNSHTADDYRRLAGQFGVTLESDFVTAGWEADLKRGEYQRG